MTTQLVIAPSFRPANTFLAKGPSGGDDTAAIQASIDLAGASERLPGDVLIIPPGIYIISGNPALVFSKNITVRAYGATFNYGTGTGTALKLGRTGAGQFLEDFHFFGGHVKRTYNAAGSPAAEFLGNGWQFSNVKGGSVKDISVEGFNKGLQVLGDADGSFYTTYGFRSILNCLLGIAIDLLNGGVVNENVFIGGRVAVTSGLANYTGINYIRMPDGSSNNHKFYNIALESNVTTFPVERKIKIAGHDNYFIGCRYEGTNGTTDIELEAGSTGNVFFYGNGLASISILDNGVRNQIFTRLYNRQRGAPAVTTDPPFRFANNNTGPVIGVETTLGNLALWLAASPSPELRTGPTSGAGPDTFLTRQNIASWQTTLSRLLYAAPVNSTSATPAVNANNFITLSGGATITNFTFGFPGQLIVVKTSTACVITNNANIVLQGGQNYAMPANAILILAQLATDVWTEIARSTVVGSYDTNATTTGAVTVTPTVSHSTFRFTTTLTGNTTITIATAGMTRGMICRVASPADLGGFTFTVNSRAITASQFGTAVFDGTAWQNVGSGAI